VNQPYIFINVVRGSKVYLVKVFEVYNYAKIKIYGSAKIPASAMTHHCKKMFRKLNNLGTLSDNF
jgi:hypothetical protein